MMKLSSKIPVALLLAAVSCGAPGDPASEATASDPAVSRVTPDEISDASAVMLQDGVLRPTSDGAADASASSLAQNQGCDATGSAHLIGEGDALLALSAIAVVLGRRRRRREEMYISVK